MANRLIRRASWTSLLLIWFCQSASAFPANQVRLQLDNLIAAELLSATSEFQRAPSNLEKDRLIALLSNDPRVLQAGSLSKELVSQVVHDNFVRHRTSLEEARSLATYYTEKILQLPSPVPTGNFLQLLIPYVREAGFCSGDPLSETGASCGFSFVPDEFEEVVEVTGSVQPLGAEKTVTLPTIAPGSNLYEVMTGCSADDEQCRQLALPLVNASISTESQNAALLPDVHDLSLDKDIFGPDMLLRLLGIKPANAGYSGGGSDEKQISASGVQVRIPYVFGFYFRYKCGFLFGISCDVWGEVYVAANIKYLVVGSDTIFSLLPVSFHCPFECVWGGAIGYAGSAVNDKWLGGSPTFDPFTYLLWAADPRYSQLRAAGSYARHTAKGGCGVLPMPYQTRVSHQGASAYKDEFPYSEYFDFSFHTSFQVPHTDPLVPVLSTNMDPTPTRAVASLPQVSCNPLPITVDFIWTYDFLMEIAWSNNVMFSGLDNYNPINFCGADEFWTWHGASYSGPRGMPTIDWTAGFAGGHLPYL